MTIAINSQDFRSSTPFDPERWRRTYARRSSAQTQRVRASRAPGREFGYQSTVRNLVPAAHGDATREGSESSVNVLTLLVAALLTALVVVGLVAVAEFASGGEASGGIHAATAVGASGSGQ